MSDAAANAAAITASRGDGSAPLTARQKALYAVGDVADGIKNTAVGTFLLFYFTAVCGLSGSLAGIAVATALIIDALIDPLIGYASDNTRSRWGRRHPYMYGSAIPFAVGIGLLFSIPRIESTWSLFAYATCVLIVLRLAFSTFVLPYAALGAELSNDYVERSVIMTYRNFFNICAQVTCIVLGFGVFMGGEHGLTTRAAYVPFGWVCGAIILVATLTSATSALGLRVRLHDTTSAPRASSNLLAELRDVFRNPSFLVLFLTVVVFWVAQGTAGSLQVHVFRYFWKLSPATIQGVLVTGTVGLVLGIPLCGLLLKRMEKRDVAALGLALFCVGQFVTPTLAIVGWMPDGATLPIVLGAFALGVGTVITFVGVSFGSMMIDAADEHELLFGVRREALYFAGLVFAGKCAIGAGALIAGVALDTIGFPSNLSDNPDRVIGAEVVRNLGLIYGPGASLISVVSVGILLRYRLDHAALTRIQKELSARRAAR